MNSNVSSMKTRQNKEGGASNRGENQQFVLPKFQASHERQHPERDLMAYLDDDEEFLNGLNEMDELEQ